MAINPSQPPSILKRTESRAPSPYQRPNSPASRPVSPGRNYNQNQYNRNQYPYNMQYPYLFPPTYPPLFYYPNPWMFLPFTNQYPGQNPSQVPHIGPNITMPNWYPYNLRQGDAAGKVKDGVCYTMATNRTGCEVKMNLEKLELQDFDLENSGEFYETEPENENRGPVKKLTGKERIKHIKEEVNTVNCSDEDSSRETDDTDSEASSTSVTMYPLHPKQTKTSLARANGARDHVQGAQERQNSSNEKKRRKRSKIAPPTPPPHPTDVQGELNASTIEKRLKLRRQMSDK
ncbi:hypothetical protein QAD02_021278 [Eretmocerus hayati]|uniref:Uncharacterized protein n=1 Tax=Eretmocerus hayati TaxID=131215 RepID=A0ACC2PUM1_9HYME|nr:hypothetical protein QAD02_021278 [Eretmocerus hayati]